MHTTEWSGDSVRTRTRTGRQNAQSVLDPKMLTDDNSHIDIAISKQERYESLLPELCSSNGIVKSIMFTLHSTVRKFTREPQKGRDQHIHQVSWCHRACRTQEGPCGPRDNVLSASTGVAGSKNAGTDTSHKDTASPSEPSH